MGKQYNIIYADPPWKTSYWSPKSNQAATENYYPVMSLVDICKLDVPSIAADQCALFLWITYPHLMQVHKVLDAWGFSFSTVVFTWVKTSKNGREHIGRGYYTRHNPEICILAKKGRVLDILSHSIRNLQYAQVQRHSQKPDIIRDLIVELFGDLPRIELFARPPIAKGWDAWGNEVVGDIDLGSVVDPAPFTEMV